MHGVLSEQRSNQGLWELPVREGYTLRKSGGVRSETEKGRFRKPNKVLTVESEFTARVTQ